MTTGYLLDTNVLSEPLRARPNAGVLAQLAQQQGLATAAPVWHELCFGAERLPPSARKEAITAFLNEVVLSTIPILPYDDAAAAWHAAERARLVREGRTPPFVDGQIAAIAAVNDLVLVTANVVDFTPFSNLRVEDWRS